MAKYLLGVDNGSSEIRVGLYDTDGSELAVAKSTISVISEERAYFQCDQNEMFNETVGLIKSVVETASVDVEDILAMGFTGHGNGLYLMDENGAPTYNGIYSIDRRSKSLVDKWCRDGVDKELQPYTNQRIWAGQLAALIKWCDRNIPDVLENSNKVLLVKDYMRYRFTGDVALEKTDFSGTSLYNVVEDKFDDRILEILGLQKYKRLFSEVVTSEEVRGVITPEIVALTGLGPNTKVVAGMCGLSASAIAAGLVDDTDDKELMLNVYFGSWANNQYVTKDRHKCEGRFMTSIHATSGNCLVSRMSATSTRNLSWFVEVFLKGEKERADRQNKSIYNVCSEAVASTSPYDSNVVFLPYLFDSLGVGDIKGSLFNIRVGDGRDIIIRAIYEGVVFAHKQCIGELIEELPEDMVVRVTGGRGDSSVWWQMLADVLQRPVEAVNSTESRTYGVAMCAGVGVGVFKDYQDAVDRMVWVQDRFEPDLELKDIYEKKYNMYLEFIEKCL